MHELPRLRLYEKTLALNDFDVSNLFPSAVALVCLIPLDVSAANRTMPLILGIHPDTVPY